MNQSLRVSASPHVRDARSTTKVMLDVIIALVPAGVVGVVAFGMQALVLILAAVAACLLTELICQKAVKRTVTISDLSAVVTGILIAYNMPHTAEWWQVVIVSAFSIAVCKQLFGGIGCNFVNPALIARVVAQISWPMSVSTFYLDGVSGATPLTVMKGGAMPEQSILDMFLGTNMPGCIGEISALALLVGGVYLVVRGVIKINTPVAYVATVAVFVAIYGACTGKDVLNYTLAQVLGGGLMLGAIFMATDYVTAPMTGKGQIIFGVGCGPLTSVIRLFGGYPEGVSYSILLMNIVTPLIDKWTAPRIYGTVKEVKQNG